MVTFSRACLLNHSFRRFVTLHRRLKSTMTNRGLVLGIYQEETNGEFTLTKAAQSFQSQEVPGLSKLITRSGLASQKGKSRVFYDQHEEYGGIAVVSLGKQNAGFNELEELDEGRENVRTAVARGVKQLQDAGIKSIDVEPCGDPEAAAEGAFLGTYYYDMLKNEKKPAPELKCYTTFVDSADSVNTAWNRGRVFAEGQNFARDLQETPSNHLTPTRFGEIATEKLGKLERVTVIVRDRMWAEQKKMFSFLSVANGSDEPPKFVELEYKGRSDNSPSFALVGKGVTFDSGGISIKPSADMDQMRADMGGGACVLASIYTAARLKLPINIKGDASPNVKTCDALGFSVVPSLGSGSTYLVTMLSVCFIPLTENMPSGKATKPGDVVTSMSGKTIQINNTDAEGRLILCDALTYAQTFNPTGIVDLATLTGAIGVALGSGASGVYTNSSYLWENMHKAGTRTGDRVWKMPLFKLYAKQMKDAGHLADLNNVSGSRAGGSCTAAAFLKEFVNHERWMHMDIAASVLDTKNDEVPYLPKGMSGRPTRTVVEFLSMISKH